MLRVTIGPSFLWRLLRIGSRSEKDFMNHEMLLMMGMLTGPGGRVWAAPVFALDEKRLLRRAPKRRDMEILMRMMIQVSMIALELLEWGTWRT